LSSYRSAFSDEAAIGIVQLGKVDTMLEQRAAQAKRYGELLAAIEEISPPFVPDYATPAWSSYCIRLGAKARVSADDVVRRMAKRNVSCRRGIQPLHFEPYFAKKTDGLVLPETEAAAGSTMFLPIFPGLTESEQDQVALALKESLVP
jgi:perosamine synthetase